MVCVCVSLSSLCLPVCLFVCLPVCLFIETYHFLPVGVCVHISFFSLSAFHLSLYLYLSLTLSLSLSFSLSHSLFSSLSIFLFSISSQSLSLSLSPSLYFLFRMSNFLVGLTFPYISQVNQHFIFAATITLNFHFSVSSFQFHKTFHLTFD